MEGGRGARSECMLIYFVCLIVYLFIYLLTKKLRRQYDTENNSNLRKLEISV